MGVVQFTDDDIRHEQAKSVMVQTLKRKGSYRGRRVIVDDDGLVNIEVDGGGKRVILPAVYWTLAFKEAHDSIWAGHLRGPQTLERLQRMYWWPHMKEAVHSWVSACQDCGSRKAKPQTAVPPLRSVRTGDVRDRWAIDVAGPLPVTEQGNRYVIAAVEYTTRYAVAEAVPEHTAKAIPRFLMHKVMLVYGPMREIMTDCAMEFGSQATTELLELMQSKQSTPVPYRPKLLGLVERFHRTWKDMVSLYVNEGQDDWDDFLPCDLYAYNGSQHATHRFQPNERVMGRKLRTPAELLRRGNLKRPHRTLDEYHEVLMQDLRTARELAAIALQKEQARQAMYYNQRNVRQHAAFRPGQLVWIYRPARGPGITKFGHRWRGPAHVVEAAGYDNYLVKMLESGRELITHCSFLLTYYYPTNLLDQMATDIALDLREEAIAAADIDASEDENSSGWTSQTELGATDGANNRTTEAVDVTPVDSTAMENEPRGGFGATPAFNDQQSSAQAIAHLASPTVAGKRPRGRPRKRASDIAAEHDIDTAIGAAARASTAATVDTTATVGAPARVEIRTAANETTDTAATPEFTAPDERAPKRRRRQRTVGALNDTIAGRTRSRIRREPYRGVDTDGRAARDDCPRGARAAEHALVVSSTHSTATGRHSESSEDGRTHERLGADLQHSAAVRQFDAEGGEASRQAWPQQPEQQPSAETEESETLT
ncbi:unnamed protein product [Phytophthora fragariaefolia]|uniref:Unnamed protein product n=1 Tax=Phytophthora fragariaefolia TaxID=1490495 RepID=A0A9W7CZG1_9STRA|nr:unnamed protein product [Phytophthora fragariaefolia]